MPESHGTFVWYELMASDMDAAEQFYRHVVNWSARAIDVGMDYRMLSAGEQPVAGIMATPEGVPVSWIGYVDVASVDQTVDAVRKAGGTVYREPWNIESMNMRLAIIGDPQGASLALHQNLSEGGGMPEVPGNTPGHGSWRELHARDGEAAFGFYAPLFGWELLHTMDMGAIGTYRIFGKGSTQMGGMFSSPAAAAHGPYWLYYFNIENAEAAAARVREGGGKVTVDPHQVPGGSWIVQCQDPQGAPFGLVAPAG